MNYATSILMQLQNKRVNYNTLFACFVEQLSRWSKRELECAYDRIFSVHTSRGFDAVNATKHAGSYTYTGEAPS